MIEIGEVLVVDDREPNLALYAKVLSKVDGIVTRTFTLARKLGLSTADRELRDGAVRVYDIGKLALPDRVLSGTGRPEPGAGARPSDLRPRDPRRAR